MTEKKTRTPSAVTLKVQAFRKVETLKARISALLKSETARREKYQTRIDDLNDQMKVALDELTPTDELSDE